MATKEISIDRSKFTIVKALQGKSATEIAEMYLQANFENLGPNKHRMGVILRHTGFNAWNNKNYSLAQKKRWELLVRAMIGGSLLHVQWFAERDPMAKAKLRKKLDARDPHGISRHLGQKTIYRPWFTCAHTGKKYYAADYGHRVWPIKVDR